MRPWTTSAWSSADASKASENFATGPKKTSRIWPTSTPPTCRVLSRGVQTPTLDVINRIARALGVTLVELFKPLDSPVSSDKARTQHGSTRSRAQVSPQAKFSRKFARSLARRERARAFTFSSAPSATARPALRRRVDVRLVRRFRSRPSRGDHAMVQSTPATELPPKVRRQFNVDPTAVRFDSCDAPPGRTSARVVV